MAPKIAIIGAGPGGCCLARMLHQNSIACAIFEGELSIDYRSQGGTLDLRTRTGLQAVQEAGLWSEFQKYARYDGESLNIYDKKGQSWLKRTPSKPGKQQAIMEAPEIDRAQLRRILIESLPEGVVRWGYKLKKVEGDQTSGLTLKFDNGKVEKDYDLIVGCDGAFSKTRNLLSSEKPFYAGVGGFAMSVPDAANKAPELYQYVNRGSVFSFGDLKSMTAQQMGDGSLDVSYYAAFDEDFKNNCGFDVTDLEEVKAFLRKEMRDWTPQLQGIFEKCESTVTWRDLYMLPVGFRWEHQRGVTLLGDAAHLMTPFGGIGVNNALHDASLLSQRIVKFAKDGEIGDLDKYIQKYENEMFESSKEAAILTEGSMRDMMLEPGAPRARVESYVGRHAKAEFPKWTHPLITAAVYTIYFFIKLIR